MVMVGMFCVWHDGYCSVVMSGHVWSCLMYLCHVSVSAPHAHVQCLQAVAYVDAQRNMAVTMGERDVKSDVKEKSRQELHPHHHDIFHLRRDKYKAFMERCVEGDTAESFIVQAIWLRSWRQGIIRNISQAEAEIKRGSNIAAPLVYLDKAVEACDDEMALNARSRYWAFNELAASLKSHGSPPRCYFHFGEYEASIKDAWAALHLNPSSMAAMHSLGRAFYSSGRFESALVHFYRARRQEQRVLTTVTSFVFQNKKVRIHRGVDWPVRRNN